jgi:glycosyltransferase involved in cell wall biosynthesis
MNNRSEILSSGTMGEQKLRNSMNEMKQQVQISVIIPVYKVENYLRRCLDSVCNQTFEDFEVILVDDGSPDASGEICDEYAKKDPRFHVIHKPNGGVSSARNEGIKKAIGKYVVFIDSDDEVSSDYLELLNCEDYDWVITGINYLDQDGNLNHSFDYPFEKKEKFTGDELEQMIKNKCFRAVYSKRYRTQIIHENNLWFDENISLGEDTLFLAEYACYCSSIVYVSGSPYNYYIYENRNTLSSYTERWMISFIEVHDRIKEVLQKQFDQGWQEAFSMEQWGNFSYSIFTVGRDKEMGIMEKYQALKKIFKNNRIKPYLKNISFYMPEDNWKIRLLLKTRSAFLATVFFTIV